MSSEFLKRKAAEQLKRTATKNAAAPHIADKQKNTQTGTAANRRSSAFLRHKAEEQARWASKRYGEDVYGGTKWRETKSAALSSDALSGLQQRVQALGAEVMPGADTARTSGGYYSRPLSSGDNGDVMKQIGELTPAMRRFAIQVENARDVVMEAGDKVLIIEGYRDRALSAYQTTPSAENAETYNKIDAAYKEAYSTYTEAHNKYYAAYTDYKTVENQVGEILSVWQQYEDQQQAAFDSWRGTIREGQVVQAEMAQLDEQIRRQAATVDSMARARASGHYGLGQGHTWNLEAEQEKLDALRNARALLQEEYDWSQYYKYADFANASDFAEKSKYVSTANGQTRSPMEIMMGSYTAGSSGWDDPLYEYINGNEEAGAYVSNMAATAYGADNGLGAVFGRAAESKAESQQMTEDEVAIFNYLYATQGRDAALTYYQYLQEDLNYRQRKEDEKYWSDYAQRRPVLSSVFSTLISPAKGMGYLGQAMDLAEDGRIDQNAAYNKFSYAPNTIRGQVAKQIEDSGNWGPVGSFAYQTGMSMADFLFTTGITGGTQGLSLAIMGTGAAADATIAAKDRGLSDGQAFTLGTVAGLAEMVMEKVSLEALLNPNLLREGSLKYIFKNMLAEGSEEVGTDVINLFADILVAKDQSEWQQSIDAYVRAGKTEEEAFGLAFADQAAAMGLDFLGGALSGGIMSGGAALAFNKHTAQLGHELEKADLDTEDIQTFIDEGLDSDPDTDAYYIAQEMQAKLDAGEEVTAQDLARMQMANAQAIAAEEEQAEEPEGLSLPTLEEEQDITPDRINAPASLAERMRQEQNMNGGTGYERGADLPDGSTEWNVGQSTAEQAGQLAGGAEQQRQTYVDQSRTAVERQNRARNLRLERISSQQLGLENGTESQNIQVVPQEYWDDEMSQVAGRIYNETGKPVTYVVGRIQIRGAGGSVSYARGVITADQIIVQADHLRLPIEQIADHEAYHAKADFAGGGRLNAEIRRHIIDMFSEEEFIAVMDRYIDALRGIYDINAAETREEYEAMLRSIEEEVYADAYAGINAFGANADRFTEAINEKMGEFMLGKQTGQENGVEQPTGPPAERFSIDSIAGEETDYGVGVVLDTDIFDGVRPRAWGEVLGKYVYTNLAGTELTVHDEQGNQETIYIARLNDRVRKDGAKNSHKVIDKLARYRGDNIRALATVHLSELLATSRYENTTDEHNHQWLDENGWEHRKTYVQDRSGNIYEATLNIANGRDRRILYDVNNVRLIDKKRAARGAVPSTKDGRGSLTKGNSLGEIIADSGANVKERYSYGGENAHTADLDALERAKKMKEAGVADETIRQQTGWHEGMDGKWRFEIDDSKMQYTSRGDLGLRERRPEYARYRDLLDKSNRYVLELSDDALTPEETAELQKLKDIWGGTFRKAGRITEDALPADLLSDYVKHDDLFEAYPQLRKTRLRFADLPEGTRGRYHLGDNSITLNKSLRNAPEDTLIHEIQHAIQNAEGFAGGSSPEYWDGKAVAKPEYETEIQKAKANVEAVEARFRREWNDDINLNLTKQYVELNKQYWGEETEESVLQGLAEQMEQIEQAAEESGWRDLLDDYYYAVGEMQMAIERARLNRRTSRDLYQNTAGEIEARDAAARRRMDREARRAAKPAGADEHTVFVEGVDELSLLEMDEEYGPQLQSYFDPDISVDDIQANIRQVAQMDPVTRISGEDFAKGEKDLTTQVEEFFAELGNSAYNDQLGDVILDRRGVKSDIAHGIGRKKAAAFAAVPEVISQGLIVDYQRNWKDRGYDTAVVAAPITIGTEDHIAGVVLTRSNQTNRFYVHEVLTTKDGAMPFKTGTRKKGAPGGDAPSVLNILNQIRSVKGQEGSVERFSVDDADGQQDYAALQAEFQSDQRTYKENWFRERLGDEGYEQYRKIEAERQKQEKQTAREQQKQKSKEKAEERKARTDAKLNAISKAEAKKLETADKPARAKQNLKTTLLDQFSIPVGKKTELARLIDNYADRLIKNGRLTEDDRNHLFDRLYESGVMTEPPNEYFAEAREYLKSGRIYVPDRVVNDFGDDWNDIRRRAFAAGIYLTRSRTADGHATAGIDMWNHELATELPGLFNSEETDERSILERIVQVAEEGKTEKYSLPEYTALLAGRGEINTDEFMIEMERRVDWALRAFASEADLEIKLKQKHIKDTAALSRENIRVRARAAAERDARKEMSQRQRDRKELQELQQRTLKTLQWLNKNRNRAPEELRAAFDEVLSDIDLYAVGAANEMQWSSRYKATWQDLAQMYKDAQKHDPNFMPSPELERIVDRLDGTKIADMDLDALQDLYKAAVGLRTEFYNRNNVINDKMQRLFAEVYSDAKREIEAAPGGFTGGIADKFMNMEQLTPMNVMQRMAGWDPDSTFYAMAKQLEKGEKDIRSYTVRAQKILEQYLKDNEDFMKRADGQGKDAIWYEVEVPQLVQLGMGDKPIFGPTVKVYMTPAQKVHMYLESKNLDNLRHMTGGRTFVNKELYSQGKRQEALAQGTTIRLAPETVRGLVSDLTPEEMELARVLDQYYNSFATQEINRVSNILYGYDKAMGKNYAPIYTNRNYTKTEFGVFDTTAEGVGNLKGRQYAVNPSYNISAIDAFERHVDQTARFVGMAIPARNWTTLMNWREENNSTGDVITHKWGDEAKKYIADLITTLQAGDDVKTDIISSLANKAQSNYISAVFGANPSIVLKQLGSIPLAGAYLDARNMPTPAQMKNIDRGLISKYTQELEWRTMGYTTPETKQLKDNPNWTQTNKAFKFVFGGGAITAMDGWAASTLWPWAENKVRRENPELEIGDQAQIDAGESPFYKKVAEEFDNAVSRSQSVSDEIHQGRLRKSKNPITRAFTMFRSDSAQTYNTLRQKIGEAQFHARSGSTDKVVRSAKKAVGTAFIALLLNAVWAEAINLLMALWKKKDKRYRDEEDELTMESVAGEMVSGMVGSFSGVVTGGEELLEVIGNILTGETLYDIETPGMEQLNDIIETVTTAGGDMRDLVAGGWDIANNGGDLGEYLGEHTGQILGNIKDLAVAAVTYLPGLPASNLESYLIGALKLVSPELGTAYDDLFADVGKSDLSGMEGGALVSRVSSILSDRRISESDETAEALAALYEADYKEAVPGDIPTSISINGEKRELGVYQQQSYSMIWSSIVSGGLDELVSSSQFQGADEKNKAKMLSSLYSYAAEQTKAELFDDYEMDAGAVKNAEIVAAGMPLADCIAWSNVTGDMKSWQKAEALVAWNLPNSAKRAVFRNKISDSREDTVVAFQDAGLNFDQFLQAYSKYSEINGMDLRPDQKAVEFAHWANDQGYDPEQVSVVKDELTYFSMTPASANRYDGLVGAGMDPDDAYDLTGVLDDLEPEEGQTTASDLQKWRASVDFSEDVEMQLTALSIVMSPTQFIKVEIANDFGVTPDAYVSLQEIKPQFDADHNGSYKNEEIKAAIEAMTGRYTAEQKAVLWQLATGSTSAKNNPYSRQVGQKVIDARKAAKDAAKTGEEEETESFSQAIANQWSNRG